MKVIGFLLFLGLLGGFLYINERQLTFGYFKPKQYVFYLKEYFKRNNISLKEVAKFIHPKSWHFLNGLPLRARLSKESIFAKEARKKIIFNSIGIFAVFIIILLFLLSL